ncbi:MAG: prolyl oligopeptidase family serine peptidase [Planctomycetota bacterium]
MLLLETPPLPDLADVAQPWLPLAGLRVQARFNARFETRFGSRVSLRATLPTPENASPVEVVLPPGSRIEDVTWSHDGQHFAVVLRNGERLQLWRANVQDPGHPELWSENLNTIFRGPSWTPDGQQMLCLLVPGDRGAMPTAPRVPSGPAIQESLGNTSPVRTYQDLLGSPYDESLFRYFVRNQLAILQRDGSVRTIGRPANIDSAELSPDGQYVLVERIEGPLGYHVTYSGFPHVIEVWDMEGKVLRTVARLPMEENVPIGGVRTGARRVQWMGSRPCSLAWVDALDGGDPKAKAEHRDRLMAWHGPFEADPTELLRTRDRIWTLFYFSDPDRLAVRSYDRERNQVRTELLDLGPDPVPTRTIEDRSMRERYRNPGSLVLMRDEFGSLVVQQEGDFVFRTGRGSTPEGDRPFLTRMPLAGGPDEELWRCGADCFEEVLEIWPAVGGGAPRLITRHETPTSPPNLRLWDLSTNSAGALTAFADPLPILRGIKKTLVHYKRADGIDLSATLYLPAGYEPGTPLPLLIWAYPLEYRDKGVAGQVAGSEMRFTRMAGISHLTLVTQGYAVMDDATMPVVGDPETMNDTFLDQIVMSAQAAIDKAVEMGVADGKHVAVGGHSYGAFMTANLLAHCDLFQAGIARSGAYNRTLTPFGFQSERRSLWQARSAYVQLSPLFFADHIQEPLLLVHGEMDNNPGTFPIQSERMFEAIKGNGGNVRLVMLPFESHAYQARQSVLHTQAEMIQWLDRFLK